MYVVANDPEKKTSKNPKRGIMKHTFKLDAEFSF